MIVGYRYFANNQWSGPYECDSDDFKKLWKALMTSRTLTVTEAYVWEVYGDQRMWVWHRDLFRRHWIECEGDKFAAKFNRFYDASKDSYNGHRKV